MSAAILRRNGSHSPVAHAPVARLVLPNTQRLTSSAEAAYEKPATIGAARISKGKRLVTNRMLTITQAPAG